MYLYILGQLLLYKNANKIQLGKGTVFATNGARRSGGTHGKKKQEEGEEEREEEQK